MPKDLNLPIGSGEKQEFFFILNGLFPDHNYSRADSPHHSRAELVFAIMEEEKWTVAQFREVMRDFTKNWPYATWMPTNLFQIFNRKFPKPTMVI